MKAIIFSICVVFVCSTALQAQPKRIEIETKKNFQLKGKVKQVVNNTTGLVLKFTPEGYLQFSGFPEDGKLKGRTFTYDKTGHLLKENGWGSTTVYTYNVRGQMIKEQTLSGGKCTNSKTFLYDMNGNARQETSSYGPTCMLNNTYDSQKRLIKIERLLLPSKYLAVTTDITYLPNGWTRHTLREKSTIIVNEFDNKGRERSSSMNDDLINQSFKIIKNYDADDNLIEFQSSNSGTTLYTYNDEGEQTSKEETVPVWGKTKIEYTYPKHDAVGNWTERIANEGGKQTTEKRTIDYYKLIF